MIRTPPFQRAIYAAVVIAIAAGALWARLPGLTKRPMHTDEAVHAVKLGILLDEGTYTYNPREFHGPTIYYATLPFVWAFGASTYANIPDERALRMPIVFFGVGLIVLLLFARDGLRPGAGIVAAALTAASPSMSYYSRYYIQEMLLVFFIFALIIATWRWGRSHRIAWAVAAGVFAGLAQATKETIVITGAAMAAALVLTVLWGWWRDGEPIHLRTPLRWPYFVAAILFFLFVSSLFLTNFFHNPRAAWDTWVAYAHYLGRGAADIERADGAHFHEHPWFYYLKMLIYYKNAPGPWWSEAMIVVLAVVGGVSALIEKRGKLRGVSFRRYLVFYTILTTVIYSGIPYKTPWCMLSFLQGMILLAGVGFMAIWRWLPWKTTRAVACLALLAGVIHLGQQSRRANTTFRADARNPYVYAHTSPNFLRLVERVGHIAAVHPEGDNMLINVYAPDGDCWPLPWYLRRYPRVNYYPQDFDAAMVLTRPEYEETVAAQLRDDYQNEYYGLRHEVLMTCRTRRDLWDAFIETRSQPQE